MVTEKVLDEGWFGWAEFLRKSYEIGKTLGTIVEPDLAEQLPENRDSVLS